MKILAPVVALALLGATPQSAAVPNELAFGSLAISRDGRFAAYDKVNTQTHGEGLFVADLRTGELRKVDERTDTDATQGSTPGWPHPQWSQDGSRLAYMILHKDGYRLHVWDRAKNSEVAVSKSLACSWHPTISMCSSLSRPQWSPDGRYVIFIAEEPSTGVGTQASIPMNGEESKSGGDVKVLKSDAVDPSDKTHTVRVWRPAPPNTRIIALDVQDGTERTIAAGMPFAGVFLSRDRSVGVAMVDEPIYTDDLEYFHTIYRLPLPWNNRRVALKRLVYRFRQYQTGAATSLSPSGRLLAYTDSGSHASGDVHIVDTETGATRNITASLQLPKNPLDFYADGRRQDFFDGKFGSGYIPPIWSPDENAVYVVRAVQRPGWRPVRFSPANFELWKISTAGLPPQRIPTPKNISITGLAECDTQAAPCLVGDAHQLPLRVRFMRDASPDHDTSEFIVLNPASGAIKKLQAIGEAGFPQTFDQADQDAGLSNIVVSSQNPVIVGIEETPQHPQELFSVPVSGPGARSLQALNPGPPPPVGKTVRLTWKSVDGEMIGAMLRMPPNLKSGQRPPVIGVVYDGYFSRDGAAFDGGGLEQWYRPLRTHFGYATLQIDTPIAHTRHGTHCSDAGREVNKALDAVIASGLIDPKRVGIIGHSFGGYSVNCLITRVHRFNAAVSVSGLANWTLVAEGFEKGGYVDYLNLPAGPWKYPQAFVNESPIFQLNRVTTPLLLVNGHDGLEEHAREMFADLSILGKPVESVMYEKSGHEEMLYYPDFWNRVHAWFEKYFANH